MMVRKASLLLVAMALASCAGGGVETVQAPASAPDTLTVRSLLAPLVRRDYEGVTQSIASCNGQPEDYRRQVAMLYKQRFSQMAVERFRVSRIDVPRDSVAEVYLLVEPSGGTAEEILVELVYTDRGWQLR